MKKKYSKMFIVNHGTYPFDILVCVNCEHKNIVKFIEKNKKYKLTDSEKEFLMMSGVGRTVMLLGGQTILRINDAKDIPNLAHEVFHAVEFLFNKIGIKHSDDSSEAFAYQISYLMGSILEKLK